jgi:hypothetical protein
MLKLKQLSRKMYTEKDGKLPVDWEADSNRQGREGEGAEALEKGKIWSLISNVDILRITRVSVIPPVLLLLDILCFCDISWYCFFWISYASVIFPVLPIVDIPCYCDVSWYCFLWISYASVMFPDTASSGYPILL